MNLSANNVYQFNLYRNFDLAASLLAIPPQLRSEFDKKLLEQAGVSDGMIIEYDGVEKPEHRAKEDPAWSWYAATMLTGRDFRGRWYECGELESQYVDLVHREEFLPVPWMG